MEVSHPFDFLSITGVAHIASCLRNGHITQAEFGNRPFVCGFGCPKKSIKPDTLSSVQCDLQQTSCRRRLLLRKKKFPAQAPKRFNSLVGSHRTSRHFAMPWGWRVAVHWRERLLLGSILPYSFVRPAWITRSGVQGA